MSHARSMTAYHSTPAIEPGPDSAGAAAPPSLHARDLVVVRGGRRLLDDISLRLAPGELVAVVGASGAGKSTLLATLAGLMAPVFGSVELVGAAGGPQGSPYGIVGLVPQDDILHPDLPLQRTLRHAAGLRLVGDRHLLDAAVREVMEVLELVDRATVPVGALSGGQRKRASIAVELLARPSLCLLDEPTSGLDPATARSLVGTLRAVADRGAGVAFTTHALTDVDVCDRLLVLAPGGRLVYDGPPAHAAARLGVERLSDLYGRLPDAVAHPGAEDGGAAPKIVVAAGRPSRPWKARRTARDPHRPRPSGLRQFTVLTHRAAEIVVRNRLTLSILLGSPAAVIAMFAVLFQPGQLSRGADPTGAVMEAYWLAFAGFFFGMTYGLLQICTEIPVMRREHQSGVSDAAYLASKAALLTPLLLAVNLVMLAVLRALGRLPDLPRETWASLFVTMGVNTVVALFLGLLASAAVTSAAQAALALPMLCFPAVLFSGAMVPVPVMTRSGATIAATMPDRWAFEAIARQLGVSRLVTVDSPYVELGRSSSLSYWGVLVATGLILVAAAYLGVRRRGR
jgi:ABC-type multidrug transport system ATPase subunit